MLLRILNARRVYDRFNYVQWLVYSDLLGTESSIQHIYTPGEKQDTRVQPFLSKLMICNKCQMFGHTARACVNAKRCRLCSEEARGE